MKTAAKIVGTILLFASIIFGGPKVMNAFFDQYFSIAEHVYEVPIR